MEKPQSRLNLWIFALSLVALIWANNSTVPLWNADEAAYAGLAKTMHDSGDWIHQQFFQSDVHRKPPLHLWAISTSYFIFGINEWAVRFPSGLSIILAAWLIFRWIKEEKDESTAWLASGIFCTNFLVLTLAKVAFVDAHLLLMTTISGYALYQILYRDKTWLHWTGLWLSIALGILVKGPQILIFVFLLFLGLVIRQRSLKILHQTRAWIGLPLSLLPFGLWAMMSYQADGGEMLNWMFDWYIGRRAKGEAVFNQTGPPGYYLVTIIVAFIPYLTGLVKWLTQWFQKDKRESSSDLAIYLGIWMISGWVLYEFIPSKLPTYVIAAYPALSMVAALGLKSMDAQSWKQTSIKLALFIQILLTACLCAALIYFTQGQFGFWGLFLAILTGFVGIITPIIYVLQLEGGHFSRSGKVLVWGQILFCFLLILPIMNMIKEPLSCPKDVAQSISLDVRQDDAILLMKEDIHMVSLPFYLSLEGRLEQEGNREKAQGLLKEGKYRAIIADSTWKDQLNETYILKEKFSCFDQNTQRNNEYWVFTLR